MPNLGEFATGANVKIVLYHSVESTCAQKVRLVLAEKNLEWQGKKLNLRRGDQFSAEYLALNPKGVVPTLIHEDRVFRESTVINEYLDDAFPSRRSSRAIRRRARRCGCG